jgi:hypothetical protein
MKSRKQKYSDGLAFAGLVSKEFDGSTPAVARLWRAKGVSPCLWKQSGAGTA